MLNQFEEGYDTEAESEETQSLTDWANAPTVKDLKQDYEDARNDHSTHVSDVDGWLDRLNITGSAKREKIAGRSNIQPKLIRKQAEWRYASLSEPFLSTEDIFNTAPVTYEDKEAAIQNGLVLNNQFNTKLQKVKFIDEFIRTCVDEGTVIVRTGWDFQEEEVEVPDIQTIAIADTNVAREVEYAMNLMATNPEAAQQQIPPDMLETLQVSMQVGYPAELKQVGMKTVMKTVKNQPTVEVCNYNNVIIDPTCLGDMEKAEFVIYSYETSYSELEKTGRYSNLDQINIENNNILGQPDHYGGEESSFNFTDKPRKKIVAHEYWGYWDIHGTGMVEPIKATWIGSTMIELIESPMPDKELPFITVQYLPVRKSVYGEPDGELLEENQDVIGAVTRGMIDIMGRSANGQLGYAKGTLDVTNKRKFDRGEDYEFNPAVDPRSTFHMNTYPEIPNSAKEMLMMQNNEAESMSGVKAFAGAGITGQALGETATGVRSAMDAVSKRELGILRRLAEGMKQIGRKIIAMNAEFMEEEEIIRITNDKFVEVRRDDLAGEFDLTLTISTPEADNDKAQELAFMLQTTGQTMGPEFSQLILADIARLRKMPALAKTIEAYKAPPPDPLEVALKELEVEKMRMEIAKLQSETAENYANAELDKAKARTEGSAADKSDLDFIEQESGVTQERDLQKQGQQARSNMQLKAVEHGFNMKEKAADAVIERNKPATAGKS